MFEIGSDYEIVTLETGENYEGKFGTYEAKKVYEVAAVEGTLLKLLGPDFSENPFAKLDDQSAIDKPREQLILNTASHFFVRAEKIFKSVQGSTPE